MAGFVGATRCAVFQTPSNQREEVENFTYLLGPVGCAVAMVVLMAMMGRGMRGKGAQDDSKHSDEVATLRAEVAQLRAERQVPVDS